MNKKVIVAVTGASGAIYAKLLLDKLQSLHKVGDDVAIIFSETAKKVWEYELENIPYNSYPFNYYDFNDLFAPPASGSAAYECMIVVPCSMGTLARIANGFSNDLISRSADVILKERKKCILACRETPYSLIHINNMKKITEAGAIICPASPSFYSKPDDIETLCLTVVDRILELSGYKIDTFRWK